MTYPLLCASPTCVGLTPKTGTPAALPTEGRSHLCRRCTDRMRTDLQTIATDWAEAEANLALAVVAPDNPDSKPTGRSDATGIALNEQVTAARTLAGAIVWYLTRAILDERGATPPQPHDTPTLADWIAHWHVDWIAANPAPSHWSTEAARELREAARAIHAAAWPKGARRIQTDLPCPEYADLPDPDTGARIRCQGVMVSFVWVGMPASPDLVCTEDGGHRITPEVWTRSHWKRRLGEGMDPRQATRLARLITR